MRLYSHPVTNRHWDHVQHANAYERMAHLPEHALVHTSYSVFKRVLWAQWVELRSDIRIEAWQGKDNAYPNSQAMIRDVEDNAHLYTFVTSPDQIVPGHPMAETLPDKYWAPEAFTMYNDIFRAVHDILGHVVSGGSFGVTGETNAWLAHRNTFPRIALPALWCETRGQAAWTNAFANHAELPLPERPFAEQKAGLVRQNMM